MHAVVTVRHKITVLKSVARYDLQRLRNEAIIQFIVT
jgi:hypothetical protein